MGARRPVLLRDRETMLTERVDRLMTDIAEETQHRRLAEDQLLEAENNLQGLRDFYDKFESPLAPKSKETRDAEAADQVLYDLHVEAMDNLKAEHDAHIAAIEADFDKCRTEADERFQRLLEEVEAQGFRPGAPGTSSSGTQASTSEGFSQLKDFLKRRLSDDTKDLVTQGPAGVTLPA